MFVHLIWWSSTVDIASSRSLGCVNSLSTAGSSCVLLIHRQCGFAFRRAVPRRCLFSLLLLRTDLRARSVPLARRRRVSTPARPAGSRGCASALGGRRWACCTWDRHSGPPATSPGTSCERHVGMATLLARPSL